MACAAGARAPGPVDGTRSVGLAAARGAAHGRDRPVRQGAATVPDALGARRAVWRGPLRAAGADPARPVAPGSGLAVLQPLSGASAADPGPDLAGRRPARACRCAAGLALGAFLPLFAELSLLAAACLHYLNEKPFLLLKDRI